MQMLTCKHISKKYEGDGYALRDVNFSVPAAGIFALIGRNGAGKTTLTRILATQLSPTSGSASINGIDVMSGAGSLREIIASVPQEARAINWLTPRQFIFSYLLWRGYGHGDARRKADEAARKLGISRFMDTASRKLSGGTKRKVLVATVMASEASVIFLDEPTTGLDPLSRSELWDTLSRLKKDHFIFLTTHYLEEAERLADRIGILENGRLMALGTLDELRGKVKYPYSIKILSDYSVAKPRKGNMIKGVDGFQQIVTTEDEANRISRELIKKGVRFSMNPLSLDDIFYYIVKKPLEEESYGDEKERY
jgi:ABC-2 type transport system ATP-binding protein